ncbi:MAG: hypothetical protein JSV39_01860 [Candidatus Aenigmatarchaeota archaeon]|nr:MAG: hypothetical protein JSV39_01860 [Candidatus Aenigmarchaeota archaeon]
MELILTIIVFLYAITGIAIIIGYFPTIKDLVRKKESANIHSYIIWTFTSFIAFLYALFIISDLLLEIVTGLGFASCAIILALALKLKYKKQV